MSDYKWTGNADPEQNRIEQLDRELAEAVAEAVATEAAKEMFRRGCCIKDDRIEVLRLQNRKAIEEIAEFHRTEPLKLAERNGLLKELAEALLLAEVRGAGCQCGDDVACLFARERDEALSSVRRLSKLLSDALQERDEARDSLREMRDILARMNFGDSFPAITLAIKNANRILEGTN